VGCLTLADSYHFLTSLVIYGQLPRKSNQRRIVRINNYPRIIKSQAALEYEEAAFLQITGDKKGSYGSLENPLLLVANIYYRSRRSDLSVELLKDVLERTGVVKNDRYIVEEITGAYVDQDNPRSELWLFAITHPRTPITFGGNKNATPVVYK